MWFYSWTNGSYPQSAWVNGVNNGYQEIANKFDGSVGLHSAIIGAEHSIHTPDRWDEVDYMAETVNSRFTQTPISLTQDGWNPTYSADFVANIPNNDIFMTGRYVFQASPETPYSGSVFQAAINEIVLTFGTIMRSIRDNNPQMEFYTILQTQQSDPSAFNLRSPTQQEILLSVNLSLAYGAKGIVYYLYAPTSNEFGLLDANRNPTTKYNEVQNINLNHLNLYATTFLPLTWKEGFTIHQITTEPISISASLYDVQARPPSGSWDSESETYVEVGHFKDANNLDHYMVVNRRCTATEAREFTVKFQSVTNNAYLVKDVFTGTQTIYQTAGTNFSHTFTLGPGEGKLLKLQDLSKSIDADATAHNSGRRLMRDSSGNYHLVFGSGGEIFYRKNVSGSWQITRQLSGGDGSNKYPSITERGGKVFVTWQRKNGSTHDIWFHRSSDGGATWPSGNRKKLASSVGASDPLPVITSVTTNNVVVVYRKGNNLESKHLSDNGSIQSTKTFTGVTLNSPSVANVNQQPSGSPTVALTYASGNNHVLYRFLDTGSGNWSSATNLSIIVPETAVHQTPSIACDGTISQVLNVAWHRVLGSGTIIYRKSTTHNTWPNEYTITFYGDQRRPSITSFGPYPKYILYQNNSSNNLNKLVFNYTGTWDAPTGLGQGQYPSVSTGSTQAKYVWTSSGTSPYTINLSSETLMKEGSSEPYYERQISWLDTTAGAHLTVRVKSLSLKTSKCETQTLALQPVSLDTVPDFTPATAFDYLVSAPTLLPADAESLVVDFTLWAENAEKVGSGASPKISLEFKTNNRQSLSNISGPEFSASGSMAEAARRLAVPLMAIKQAAGLKSVRMTVKVEGFSPRPEVIASLGHIYDFNKSVDKNSFTQHSEVSNGQTPNRFALLQNYPNPFNPETIIKYQLAAPSPVSLKIYNLRGQLVRALVEASQNSGNHEIRWDGLDDFGNAVASGVYLYRLQAGEQVAVKKLTLLR